MTKGRSPGVRSVIWLFHGTKVRPAIVMEVKQSGKLVCIATGTSKDKQWPGLRIELDDALAMGLTEPTNFYDRNVAEVDWEVVKSVAGVCPKSIFSELLVLTERAREELTKKRLLAVQQLPHEFSVESDAPDTDVRSPADDKSYRLSNRS